MWIATYISTHKSEDVSYLDWVGRERSRNRAENWFILLHWAGKYK